MSPHGGFKRYFNVLPNESKVMGDDLLNEILEIG
jgi:hypothetical protein